MSKRKFNDKESKPELFRLMYRAFNHQLSSNDDKANKYWEKAKRRVKKDRTFRGEHEIQFKEGGCLLPLHLAIQHAAPYSLIKEIVNQYSDGCSVKFGGESPLEIACAHPKKSSRELVEKLRDDMDWEDVILLLMKKNPAAIDAGKNTALHLVLEHDPSLELVQSIIEFHQNNKSSATSSSTVAKQKKKKKKKKKRKEIHCLLEMRDIQGQLPLHVAVEHVASDDVVLKILRAYPEATKFAREYDGALPLHCAVSFGCSGEVLTQIIKAHPYALSCPDNNNGDTPLHSLFNMETNAKRWNIAEKSDDFYGDKPLSETAICQLLFEHIPEEIIGRSLKMLNSGKRTVVQAANECAKVFKVPAGLIKLLKEAESGKLTSRKQPARSKGIDTNLTAHDPFDLSTDEGSNDPESDLSSDDLFYSKD